MKRNVLRGAVVLVAVLPALFAQPKPKSQDELEALKAMFGAATADARIAAAENVLTKFKDTEFKGVALYFEAASYDQKHDYDNTVVFGERTLEADPKNFQAMLLLAGTIAQHTKEFDLDREEKLAKVNKYAKNALELIKDAPKPNANLTDEQWAEAKKDFAAQAHASMGAGDLVAKKYAEAESEFKTAIEGTDKPDAATIVRLGKAYSEEGKYDLAIAQFDKVMATPDVNIQIRQVAQAERVRAIGKKNPAGTAAPVAPPATAPAAPSTPPQKP